MTATKSLQEQGLTYEKYRQQLLDRFVITREIAGARLTIRLPGGAFVRLERLGQQTVQQISSNGTTKLCRFDVMGRLVVSSEVCWKLVRVPGLKLQPLCALDLVRCCRAGDLEQLIVIALPPCHEAATKVLRVC